VGKILIIISEVKNRYTRSICRLENHGYLTLNLTFKVKVNLETKLI